MKIMERLEYIHEGARSGGVQTLYLAPVLDKSFFMNVKIDNTSVILVLQKYLAEVITHLSYGDNCAAKSPLK